MEKCLNSEAAGKAFYIVGETLRSGTDQCSLHRRHCGVLCGESRAAPGEGKASPTCTEGAGDAK